MNVRNREAWWLMTGLLSLLVGVGCTTGKTAEKSVAKTSEFASQMTPVVSPEVDKKEVVVATADKKKDGKNEVKPSAGSSYFVANDNIKTVYFDLNKSQLNEASQDALKQNAEWLKQNPPMLVQIAGYADSRGSLKRNQTLAERRANHVRDFYAALGIPKERVIVLTLGSEEPTCAALSDECLAKSRRVETLIESKPVASR